MDLLIKNGTIVTAKGSYMADVAVKDEKIAEIGNIMDIDALNDNIAENALPPEIINMTVNDYDDFLSQRRHLMSRMIEEYYKHL